MESLRRQEDFKYCYEKGKNIANRYLVLYVCERRSDPGNEKDEKQADGNRVGISVSKKIGNSVVRHRIKRRIKESYRCNERGFNSGLDLVIVARRLTAEADYKEIESALLSLGTRAGIWQKKD
jgi:ribonuclease P protein component